MKLFLTVVFLYSLSCSFGQSPDDYYKKAREYYKADEYDKALVQIDLAMQTDSINRDYQLLKGSILMELKQYQESYNMFNKAVYQNPTDAMALNSRALLLFRIQQFEDAIQDFDKALGFMNADSTRLSLYVNRGAAKTYIRDFQGAYDDLTAAYAIDSSDIGTLNNLASVSDEVGKGDQTLRYLNRILAIDSGFIGAWINIGFKYQGMGQYKKAIRYFDRALQIDPREALAYSNRAFNKYKLNDLKGAMEDINKAIALYPDNSYAFRTRAMIYLAQKKKTEACADMEEAIRLNFTKIYGDEVEKLKTLHCK